MRADTIHRRVPGVRRDAEPLLARGDRPPLRHPAVVIDLDRVARNIARLQAACDAAGLANRPHIKTHKNPVLARMQIEAAQAASPARRSARPR